MAKTKDSNNSGKPAKNLQKVEKPKQREVDAGMIIETIIELTSNLENGQGAALASIRNHIARTYEFRMGKVRQTIIKEIISEEFNAGNITMTNHSGSKINFTKRFDVVAEGDDDEEDPASTI